MDKRKTEPERQKTLLVIEMNVKSEDLSLSTESVCKTENVSKCASVCKSVCNEVPEKKGWLVEDRRVNYQKAATVKRNNEKDKETKIVIDDEDIITLCDTSTKAVVRSHNGFYHRQN